MTIGLFFLLALVLVLAPMGLKAQSDWMMSRNEEYLRGKELKEAEARRHEAALALGKEPAGSWQPGVEDFLFLFLSFPFFFSFSFL